jgi:hypothetical protein
MKDKQDRRSKTLLFFDPYSLSIDDELEIVDSSKGHRPYLTEMFAESPFTKCVSNAVQFQNWNKPSVSTCGRWAALRVAMYFQGVTPLQFEKLFTGQKLDPDIYATLLTLFVR